MFQSQTGTNMESFITITHTHTHTHTHRGGVCFLHTEAELRPAESDLEAARTLQTRAVDTLTAEIFTHFFQAHVSNI